MDGMVFIDVKQKLTEHIITFTMKCYYVFLTKLLYTGNFVEFFFLVINEDVFLYENGGFVNKID